MPFNWIQLIPYCFIKGNIIGSSLVLPEEDEEHIENCPAFDLIKAPSTLIRFQTKTELFWSGYGYRPHYNAENGAIRKRSLEWSDLKTMLFENAVFWLACVTDETKPRAIFWCGRRKRQMLSENGDVIKKDTTGRQTTRPWVFKMAERRYHVVFNFAPISRADILKCAGVEFIWVRALRVWKSFENGYGVVVWTGENDTKTISVDANLFENGSKQLRFRLKTDWCGEGPN